MDVLRSRRLVQASPARAVHRGDWLSSNTVGFPVGECKCTGTGCRAGRDVEVGHCCLLRCSPQLTLARAPDTGLASSGGSGDRARPLAWQERARSCVAVPWGGPSRSSNVVSSPQELGLGTVGESLRGKSEGPALAVVQERLRARSEQALRTWEPGAPDV